VINSTGVITAATFTAANINERDACPELVEKIQGLLLGDKGYMRPDLQKDLSTKGLHLQTSLRDNMEDGRPKGFLK